MYDFKINIHFTYISHVQKQRMIKINSLLLERKTKSNCMIDLRIVCDRYVDRREERGLGGSGHRLSVREMPRVRHWRSPSRPEPRVCPGTTMEEFISLLYLHLRLRKAFR